MALTPAESRVVAEGMSLAAEDFQNSLTAAAHFGASISRAKKIPELSRFLVGRSATIKAQKPEEVLSTFRQLEARINGDRSKNS